MATHIAFGGASAISPSGAHVPVVSGAPTSAESVANGASSVRTVSAASADGIARIVPDADIYVRVGGASVVASATTGWLVKANQTIEVWASTGQFVAVINA